MPVPQRLSELELKEIQHRGTFSLTLLPPDKPLFRYFQCFRNVPFSVPGKHLFEAYLPPDLWQTLWQGESFWHPESATTFVTMVPVLPPQLLLPHCLWPSALYMFVKKRDLPSQLLLQFSLFLRFIFEIGLSVLCRRKGLRRKAAMYDFIKYFL